MGRDLIVGPFTSFCLLTLGKGQQCVLDVLEAQHREGCHESLAVIAECRDRRHTLTDEKPGAEGR